MVRDRSTYYAQPYAAIRSGHFLYVDYATGDEELYNLARDPDQLRSVAGEPRLRRQATSACAPPSTSCATAAGSGCEVTVRSGQPEAESRETRRR